MKKLIFTMALAICASAFAEGTGNGTGEFATSVLSQAAARGMTPEETMLTLWEESAGRVPDPLSLNDTTWKLNLMTRASKTDSFIVHFNFRNAKIRFSVSGKSAGPSFPNNETFWFQILSQLPLGNFNEVMVSNSALDPKHYVTKSSTGLKVGGHMPFLDVALEARQLSENELVIASYSSRDQYGGYTCPILGERVIQSNKWGYSASDQELCEIMYLWRE